MILDGDKLSVTETCNPTPFPPRTNKMAVQRPRRTAALVSGADMGSMLIWGREEAEQ